ncbi:purine and uridine phosphorylase [Acephala macrosclerotiorum]|nr:purine and uridine phosphorylase [Acephala macrosclerotiorum]
MDEPPGSILGGTAIGGRAQKDPQHRDYTIGWICSLEIEMVAARLILDEEHDSLPTPLGDNNYYAFGRIGRHNVVLACLSEGSPGYRSAAGVAASMVRSFPGLRFGVLVGIGGGIPVLKDIRLGDVVVGNPQGSIAGVIQYDFGKRSDGQLRQVGGLNNPPPSLMNAMSTLRQREMIGRDPSFIQNLSEIISLDPRLNDVFAFPGAENDLLFEPEYLHVSQDGTCNNCDLSRLVPRPERYSHIPMVHYGPIASANSIVKDGKFRDKLAATNVLCIEEGAAGLMNDFPCVVIRGICDYCDTHRNKLWQSYAALAAAAYAKDLVYAIPEHGTEAYGTVADLFDIDIDANDTESSGGSSYAGSTLIGSINENLVDLALYEVAAALSSEPRFKTLCTTATLRMTKVVFERNLTRILIKLSRGKRKAAQTSPEKAIAWLLGRPRAIHIAAQVYGILAQPQTTEEPSLRLDEIPVAQQEHLMHFIYDKFPAVQSPQAPPIIEEVRPVYEDEEEDEGDDDEDPNAETLSNLGDLARIVCTGEPYLEAYSSFKRIVFPMATDLIGKVIRRHLSFESSVQVVRCRIDWQILEYLALEATKVVDMGSKFTLTGDIDVACASRLEDYMCEVWNTGAETFNTVKSAVETLLARTESSTPETRSQTSEISYISTPRKC